MKGMNKNIQIKTLVITLLLFEFAHKMTRIFKIHVPFISHNLTINLL